MGTREIAPQLGVSTVSLAAAVAVVAGTSYVLLRLWSAPRPPAPPPQDALAGVPWTRRGLTLRRQASKERHG